MDPISTADASAAAYIGNEPNTPPRNDDYIGGYEGGRMRALKELYSGTGRQEGVKQETMDEMMHAGGSDWPLTLSSYHRPGIIFSAYCPAIKRVTQLPPLASDIVRYMDTRNSTKLSTFIIVMSRYNYDLCLRLQPVPELPVQHLNDAEAQGMIFGERYKGPSDRVGKQQLGRDPVRAHTFTGPRDWKATIHYGQIFAISHNVVLSRLEGEVLDDNLRMLSISMLFWERFHNGVSLASGPDHEPEKQGADGEEIFNRALGEQEIMNAEPTGQLHPELEPVKGVSYFFAAAASSVAEVAENSKQAYEIVLEAIGALGSLAGAAAAIYYGQKFVEGQKPKKSNISNHLPAEDDLEMTSLGSRTPAAAGPSPEEFQRTVKETMIKLSRAKQALNLEKESLERSQIKLRDAQKAMQAERDSMCAKKASIDRQEGVIQDRQRELDLRSKNLQQWRETMLKGQQKDLSQRETKLSRAQQEQDEAKDTLLHLHEHWESKAGELELQKLQVEARQRELEMIEAQQAREKDRIQNRERELESQRIQLENRLKELEVQAALERAEVQERADALALLDEQTTEDQARLEGERVGLETLWEDLTSLFTKMERLQAEMVALRAEMGQTKGTIGDETPPLQTSRPDHDQSDKTLDGSESDESEEYFELRNGREPNAEDLEDGVSGQSDDDTEEADEMNGGSEAGTRDSAVRAMKSSLEDRYAALRIG